MRISLIGKKLGMTQLKHNGKTVAATVVQILDHDILRIKSKAKDGYNAVVIAAGEPAKEKNVAKPTLGQFKKAGIAPRRSVFEIRIHSEQSLQSAQKNEDSIFENLVGRFVDVSGTTIGKGFAGVMKRHLFAGLEASHGVSVSHRSHGSTGQRQDPGRVFPGKKMAGHMGDVKTTMQNLQIVEVDAELGIIAILGSVPGCEGACIEINDSVKMGRQNSFLQVNNINLVF
jgi:large subunit ribosomal protein L3